MKIEQLSKESIVALQIHNEDVNQGRYSILVYDRVNREIRQQNEPFKQYNDLVIDLLKTVEVMNMGTRYNTASKDIFTRGELSRFDVCAMITDVEKYISYKDFITRRGAVKEYDFMTPFIKDYKIDKIEYSIPRMQYGYKTIFIWHEMEENKEFEDEFLKYDMRILNNRNLCAAIEFSTMIYHELQIHIYEVK